MVDRSVLRRVGYELGSVGILRRAGLVHPVRPDKLLKIASVVRRWGLCPAQGIATVAIEFPDRTAVIDETGSLAFGELHERTNRLANALAAEGIRDGDQVAVMCRNHRGFVEIALALSKLGADALLMNTSFAGPQFAEVATREKAVALVYDEEFGDLLGDAAEVRKRFVAWHDGTTDVPTLDDLIESGDPADRKPPRHTAQFIILTSGTTGTPKGVARPQPRNIDPVAGLLDRIPYRAAQIVHIPAPIFHSWGLAHFLLAIEAGQTMVLRRRFDPEDCLAAVADHGCEVLIAVPVMLQRILELPEEVREKYDVSSLGIVSLGGSALPGELAVRWMDAYGDTLYNTYGSTECAIASVATPQDLRSAPDTAGRPLRGSVVRLFDESGKAVPAGQPGRIFVANEILFEGYTTGGSKEIIDGMMSTGDMGRFDDEGRLYIVGRDDEMIVSGGENVFPQEVEYLLSQHHALLEAAVVGVPDEEFGQRLRAFAVLEEGAQVTQDELKLFVKEHLARYKVPREIWFLDELPRNITGKVLKRDLRAMTAPPM